MLLKPKPRLTLCFLLFVLAAGAQDYGKLKFGDVSVKDLSVPNYAIDTSAAAVVISDIGRCSLTGNNKSWFSLVFKHYRRVHILKKSGFDMADVVIDLYRSGDDEERLDKLRACTYTMENGKVVQSSLENKSIYSERVDKNITRKKFSFPNVKEGCIIEFEYTTISDFIQFPDPWEFQGAYPRLYSEYTFSVPSFFSYDFLRQGYLNYAINDRKDDVANYTVRFTNDASSSQTASFNAGTSAFRWVVKDAPAFREESFTSSVSNHIQKIQFQLAEQRDPLEPHQYIESWEQVTSHMLDMDAFGQELKKDPNWFDDITKNAMVGAHSEKEKANAIYHYVRDNFSCTDHSQLWVEKSLKDLAKSRNGSVSEINLFLVALLRHADITADPVMLSTRSNGRTYEAFPILRQFNYVIVKAIVDGKTYLLDASEPGLGFGYLPLRCYNDHARVVNSSADQVTLPADSILEKKNTSVFLVNEKDHLAGSVQQTPGYYESLDIRSRIKEKGLDQLMRDIQKIYGNEFKLENPGIDSLNRDDVPVGLHYEFVMNNDNEDILYINPMMAEGYKENPFKSATRNYPVEMPFAMDETYTLALEVPDGYKVDELPREAVVKLDNAGDGQFEYRISQSGSNLSIRSRIYLKRATYQPEEYETLREFFNLIVKKQSELIVFKKIKK